MISALTRVGNRVLALSVPGAAQGEFYRVFTRLGETRKTLVIPAAMQMDDGRYKPAMGDRLAGPGLVDELPEYPDPEEGRGGPTCGALFSTLRTR